MSLWARFTMSRICVLYGWTAAVVLSMPGYAGSATSIDGGALDPRFKAALVDHARALAWEGCILYSNGCAGEDEKNVLSLDYTRTIVDVRRNADGSRCFIAATPFGMGGGVSYALFELSKEMNFEAIGLVESSLSLNTAMRMFDQGEIGCDSDQ